MKSNGRRSESPVNRRRVRYAPAVENTMRTTTSLRSRAFTLVEILAVVVILGIASAVIIPQIGSRDDLRCSAGSRVIMSDLIYAQNRAIATQTTHYVRFDLTAQTITLYSSLSPATIISHPVNKGDYITTFGASAGPGSFADATIADVDFDDQTVLAFDELGSPYAYNLATSTMTPLNDGQIVVQSGTFTLSITIEPYTGEITVE